MIFRVIASDSLHQGRKLRAYDLFSSYPDQFAALLEDPSGQGKQFLVSAQGKRTSLAESCDVLTADAFFQSWQQQLQHGQSESPAIRCLIYAAYEASALIEVLPAAKTAVPGPVLWTLLPDFSLCFDFGQIHLAAKDAATMDKLLAMLISAPQYEHDHHDHTTSDIFSESANSYQQAVEQVKGYIVAGDVFQANIARFWTLPFAQADLLALYDRLRKVNSAPFASFVRIESEQGVLHLISASPERLFRISVAGEIDTRPIAGTRKRADGDQDDSLRAELLLSEKECAEHIMLVDLERNDLGRVCQPGSVEVNEHMVIERYATVQHIVSNVRGHLADGYDVIDVFKAMFPGGTITGCPKVRCMEIIHELENNARGPYTGGLGYVAWDGSADMNILIRSFWHHDGQLHWAAGAGIVADSDPAHELIETEHKAAGLLRALKF